MGKYIIFIELYMKGDQFPPPNSCKKHIFRMKVANVQ